MHVTKVETTRVGEGGGPAVLLDLWARARAFRQRPPLVFLRGLGIWNDQHDCVRLEDVQ